MISVSQHLQSLLKQRGTPLWGGYVNMLKTLESVFLSPRHWVLEFLQNAEDAAAKKFSIHLEQDSLWILNDGEKFSDDDFYAICDVNSRKLPSLGFRGYIGIGFKSIFRITDCIEIHSGKFHFKFDKKHWQQLAKKEGISISNWPWEILPVEISMALLPEGYKTGFHVSSAGEKGQEVFQEISEFFSREFPKEAILLLKNVEVIEVQTPLISFNIMKEIKESEILPVGEKEVVAVREISNRSWKGGEEHYLVFRKTIRVPSQIQQDEETERVRRSDISEREIGLVFGLDPEGNVRTLSGKLAGVYSFLPVEGEQTGLPFGIFGDFIPQVGRELINYGAKWNHWMCDEMVKFFKQVVCETFLAHPLWRFFPAELINRMQYNSISGPGKEFWDSKLRGPIKNFLETEALYPDESGEFRKIEELAILSDEVVQLNGLIGKDALGKLIDKKVVHTSIKEKIGSKVKTIKIDDLPQEKLLDLLKGQPKKLLSIFPIETVYNLVYSRKMLDPLKEQPQRLAIVYHQIADLNEYRIRGRRGRERPLYTVPFVLADDGNFYPPEQMMALEIDVACVPEFLKVVLPSLREKKRLHPEVAKDPKAVAQLAKCYLEVVNRQTIIRRLQQLIETIRTPEQCPKVWKYPNDLIEATLFLIAEDGSRVGRLVAQDGTLREPKNLFALETPLDWGPLWETYLLPGFQPVHGKYFDKVWLERYGLTREKINQYFQMIGVHGFHRDEDNSLIQVAGENIAKKRLQEEGHIIADVTQRNKLGYDLQCQGHCEKVFEVKGMADPHDITLLESECTAAQQKKEDYILICVYNLPNHPDRIGYKKIADPKKIWQPIGQAKVPKDKWFWT